MSRVLGGKHDRGGKLGLIKVINAPDILMVNEWKQSAASRQTVKGENKWCYFSTPAPQFKAAKSQYSHLTV